MPNRLRVRGPAALAIVSLLGCGARSLIDVTDEATVGGGSSGGGGASSSSGVQGGGSSGPASSSGSGRGSSSSSSGGVGGSSGVGSSGGVTGSSSGSGSSSGGMGSPLACGSGSACNGATMQCCIQMGARGGGVTPTCIPLGQTCTAGLAIGCVSAGSCVLNGRPQDVCCLSIGAGSGAAASCQPTCVSGGGALRAQLCTLNAECPAGLVCQMVPGLGLGACR